MDLLACVLFPERYSLLDHEGHVAGSCAECAAAVDLDKNGAFDVEDVLYLLYRSLFHGDGQYALDGCTCKDAFFVGYARADITPEGTMEIYGSTASEAAQNGEDILQMTCTAIDDGENTALLFSLDLRNFNVDFSKQMTDVIEKKFTSEMYDYNLGSALALGLMILILISMLILNRYSDDEGSVTP
jgi:hypothetical protein